MGTWNGSDLTTEFSSTLGDTSTAFKARVTKWMNDIQDDICSRFDWPFLHCLGKKLLTASAEIQNLNPSAPGSATIASSSGGALTTGSSYRILVTFVMSSNGYETEAGTVSNAITVSGGNLTLSVSALPVSGEALVTGRNIYLSKDGAAYFYYSSISDNTSTTTTITADTPSTITAPDYAGIKNIIGNPWIEASGIYLLYKCEDDIRMMFPNSIQSGTPEFFASIDYNRIMTYPIASSAVTLKFNYTKVPSRIFNDATVQPNLPIWMKNILEAGVLMKGYQYRERDLAIAYAQKYEQLLMSAISERSKSRHGSGRVRDISGNSDGYVF